MPFTLPTFSPAPTVKQLTPKQSLFVLPIFALIGLALLVLWGIPTARHATESTNWPIAEGRITTSEVARNQDAGDSGMTYSASIAFTYTVDGVEYVGSTVTFGDYGSSDPSHAGGIVARYPVGKSVQVSYEPNEPQRSVLEPGARFSSFVGLLAGGLFLLIGVIGFVVALRKVRSGATEWSPPAAPQTPFQP